MWDDQHPAWSGAPPTGTRSPHPLYGEEGKEFFLLEIFSTIFKKMFLFFNVNYLIYETDFIGDAAYECCI